MQLLAPFEVVLIQDRRTSELFTLRASECISMGFVMHLLARRACILVVKTK